MMPGNGARDPLEDWLDREIQPLPPPDGAFEAISRRARHRKMGKLVTAVSCAAAVAVVVGAGAAAVPSLLAPHASTPVAFGSRAAGRASSTAPSANPSPTAGTAGSATPALPTTQTPIGEATGSTNGYPAGGAVPDNFQPTSVTFIGQNTGWAIGQAGTPGSCANADPTTCTSIVLTQNGGQSWRGVPAPSTKDVSGIRFLNGQDGWAYGPQLWSTHDWGQHWGAVNTHGKVVTDLETSNGQAFAVFATCQATSRTPSIAFYNDQCTDFTLETAQAGTDTWTQISLSGADGGTTLTMSDANPGAITKPTILLQGGTGWFAGPLGQVFSGSLKSGTWTQVSLSPCGGSNTQAVGAAMLDWSLATGDLLMACNEQQSVTVYSSADDGKTWARQATTPAFGTGTSLTASSAAPDIVATTDGIVALSKSGQWHEAVSLRGGFSYVGITINGQGVAVPANAGLHELYMTYDGGLSWTPVPIVAS